MRAGHMRGTDPPPFRGCFPIMIATDEQAMWGRKCQRCGGYWRTKSAGWVFPTICCYCGFNAEAHEFLSDAQMAYVQACCVMFSQILRSEEHTSELQSLMRISYAVFCLKKKTIITTKQRRTRHK